MEMHSSVTQETTRYGKIKSNVKTKEKKTEFKTVSTVAFKNHPISFRRASNQSNIG